MRNVIDREELLAEVRRLADGDEPPTKAEMDEEGEYSAATYYNRFESWTEACREAGFSPHRSGNRISKENLLTELQRLADGDTPPTVTEMNEEGKYSYDAYQTRFGSWNEACREADLSPRESDAPAKSQQIPKEDLIAELRRLADGDSAPTKKEMNQGGQYGAKTYHRRFGSWTDACQAADLTLRGKGGKIPKEDLLTELKRLADGDGKVTKRRMNEEGQYSADAYQARFGSWNEACRVAGLTPQEQRIPETNLLAELRQLADGDDPPTVTEMDEKGEYSASTYKRRFGSWAEACRSADLSPREQPPELSDEELLTELKRLSDGVTPPTVGEMTEEGQYSAESYQARFGSWAEACRAADLTPRGQGGKVPEDILLDELRRLSDGDTPPTQPEMDEMGEYSAATYKNRFGTWTEACREADLTPRSQGSGIQ